ncbi:hypothetical protein [Paraurantiacibacter namhicola]|uniref:Uncharacterized protein n=1 Tax=Paraurantiacibacter namhicola TaxID=645517 RepID=A0A1C7D5M8_9SPHN|nr:hypothetical protein [Paraurantiacibacter namhicola]ANU06631.1 hypothetical protein A6F65_00304 [Paraurantiacibacter namhicola]
MKFPSIRNLAALLPAALLASACAGGPPPVSAQSMAASQATYGDLVALSEASPVVVRVEIRDQAMLEPERSPGLAPGMARVYFESRTQNVLKAPGAMGGEFAFLADVPLGPDGKVAKYKKQEWLLFARPVAGNPGQLQLVEPDAYLPASPAEEARVRAVIAELLSPDAPPVVTGIGDALWMPGNLAGESETQVFLTTRSNAPVSLSVVRRPGMAPSWGVSWSEIVDQSARPPQRGTLRWYRLACSLPATLPAGAILQDGAQVRARAQEDYAFVIDQLGPCDRTRARSRG